MLDWLFPLAIFPEGSLASSVITTVWVGVLVIAFFNLRFGWVLSGLVVPGYLVPLLIARPLSFVVIVIEASVTYFLVWLFSERLAGARSWSSLFGRDRFVALVLVSIVVRLVFDGWLLPNLATYLETRFAFGVDWTGNLHSFGLIVISLLANQLWKPGYLRGMTQAFVTIGLTYLIIRYGLMEFTNFRISGVTYLYEDLASSILASPKAYIIVVVTVFLASRMNLRYGWDFNGVLIPALLALQWYQPMKILSSFVEAFVILGVAKLLLNLPFFARMTIEGARKVVLFFNISFAYRLILGHALVLAGYQGKITDFYGFGYLLSTLMAIKMYDKDIVARLTRATLQISLGGVILGSAAGFSLTLLPTLRPSLPLQSAGSFSSEEKIIETGQSGFDFAGMHAISAYRLWNVTIRPTPLPEEFELFRLSASAALSGQPGAIEAALPGFTAVGYRLERLGDGLIGLVDTRSGRGGGSYIINTLASSDLLISVTDPVATPGLAAAGVAVLQATGARALALGGSSNLAPQASSVSLELTYDSLFQAFHEASGTSVLQLRGSKPTETVSSLEIPFKLPAGLDPLVLNRLVGLVETRTSRQGERSVQETVASEGYATLSLSAEGMHRLLAKGEASPKGIKAFTGIEATVAELQDRHLQGPELMPADTATLLYLDREVLTPLLRVVLPSLRLLGRGSTQNALAALDVAARAVNYEVVFVETPEPGKGSYLVLAPIARGWGLYVFRVDEAAEPFVVEAPRAGVETGTQEFALELFERLYARALLIAELPVEGVPNPDILDSRRQANLFDLVGQVVLREGGDIPMLVVQARGAAADSLLTRPEADVVVAFDVLSPHSPGETNLALGQQLVDSLHKAGVKVGVVKGQADTAGLEFGWVRQARYLDATQNKRFATVWMMPFYRTSFADRSMVSSETALFSALGIETIEATPASFLATGPRRAAAALPDLMIEAISSFQRYQDSVSLRQAQIGFLGFSIQRLFDPKSRQSFIVVRGQAGEIAALARVAPGDTDVRLTTSAESPAIETIDAFVQARAAWLFLEVSQ